MEDNGCGISTNATVLNILVAGETGFYHIHYEKYKATDYKLEVLLRTVTSFHQRDSVLFGGYFSPSGDVKNNGFYELRNPISYQWNSPHFEFSSPGFGNLVEYSCRLNGYENAWSDWSRKTEKTYTNLPEGKYAFEVK